MIQSTITDCLKKEVQPTEQSTSTHYFKKEIDIDWDEADNVHGEAFHNVQSECTARVVLEKLPEPMLQEYVNTKNTAPVKTRAAYSKKCSNCKKNFKNINSLRSHAAHCGKERNLQCAHCPYKTTRKKSLTVHLSKVHQNGKKLFQNIHAGNGNTKKCCPKCKKIADSHWLTKCEKCFTELLYQCNKCSKQFKTRSSAVYHWYTRCGVKGYYNCHICGFKSVWRSKVVLHMKLMHSNPDLYKELENIKWISINYNNASEESNTNKCSKCTKVMENLEVLAHHVRVCGGIKREKNCGMERENDNADHQNVKSEPMKCSSCGEHFDHIYSLNVHIRYCKREYVTRITKNSGVDIGETHEACSSKSLISADERNTRYTEMVVRYCSKCQDESAIEEKNWGIGSTVPCRKCKTTLSFKCKKCRKGYSRYKSLKVHLDTVCNPREEFRCTKCSYKAYNSGLVKGHYDSVHGTANAECKKCGSKFKSTDYLKRHLRRCGVESKFQCEHCPFKSKLKIYLRKHIFRSHMEPVVIDRGDMIKMSRRRFTRAATHLTAHCPKCKNEQRLGHRLKNCRKCKTKLFYKCKICQTKHDVDDENACDHVKAYLETIKFECKRCGRGMISGKSLWMHESKCGAKASFECRFCKYTSKIKGNTTKHEKIMHPDKAGI